MARTIRVVIADDRKVTTPTAKFSKRIDDGHIGIHLGCGPNCVGHHDNPLLRVQVKQILGVENPDDVIQIVLVDWKPRVTRFLEQIEQFFRVDPQWNSGHLVARDHHVTNMSSRQAEDVAKNAARVGANLARRSRFGDQYGKFIRGMHRFGAIRRHHAEESNEQIGGLDARLPLKG